MEGASENSVHPLYDFFGLSVTTPVFSLDLSDVPSVSDQIKESIVNKFNELDKKCRKSYTVAISKSANFWSSEDCKGKWRKKERQRRVLEVCEHKTKESCGIVVFNGKVTEFTESDQNILYPESFVASMIPFVSDEYRKRLGKDYKKAKRYKALALTPDGVYGYSYGYSSSAKAKKSALEACAKDTRQSDRCFIYAVGSDVMFNKSTNIFPDKD